MSVDITLYGYTTSPYVRKVSCYLYYKELPFKFVGVSPVEPEKTIAFSGGTQVPVLKIGEEWRRDSSKVGVWLDELFPAKPLLSQNDKDRQKITAIDDWVSDQFIPGMIFRSAIEAEMNDAFKKRAWRLADIVSSGAKMPDHIKEAWPEILKNAGFIKDLVAHLDMNEPFQVMQMRLIGELAQHLGNGPFLGGYDAPSMADLAVYGQMMFMYQVGLTDVLPLGEHPTLRPWLENVSTHLPRNPWCVDEAFITNPWPFD
ncbi:glutathione S-transferase family protein [Kordiimonas aquimaris]|uniref:glutathione S-transferase family protein n=1 Tax=Kordiimonas aquimaris TaxID=707591 RepID=UPI0021D17E66|nr:glutathione S-transferase family protein [Kordiimonas aquimaris]